jgi:cysteine synthase A
MVSRKTAIGNTALVEVDGIYAKLECANPCGSIKDRMVRYILDESEKKGFLKPGMKIIEATSGNTGISLAYFAKKMGYDVTIVMPVNMTEERKQRFRDLGAHLTLCSEEGSFAEAVSIRDDILSRDSSYFNLDQFSSPLNVECHYTTTGQEILKEHTLNPVEAFVAGVGTGGSLLGTAKALKKVYPDVHIAAVEPSESAVMSGGKPGIHGIPGIGDGFIPAIVKGINQPLSELINEVICVSSKQAQNAARRIREDYGLPVGISSGANYLAAKELFKKFGTVVTLFPDGSVLYGSLGL